MTVTKLSFFTLLMSLMIVCEGQFLRQETYQTVHQLISSASYPYEKHRVYTEDGYIIQMHRIPAGRRTARRSGDPSAKGKKAVLLMHGLFGASGDFVIMGPQKSLSYLLADEGYDVWMGNQRGNSYTSHKTYTRDNPKFWEFSFHEHGKYDLPAMIDKVLNVTGLPKLFYVGYSMGTSSFFTMLAQRPEYNDKTIAMAALAPAVYLSHIKPFVNFVVNVLHLPDELRARGMISLTIRRDIVDLVMGGICKIQRSIEDLCMAVVYAIIGEDYEQNDWDMYLAAIARFQPASWRQLEHFAKIALTDVFTYWEDGLNGIVRPYNLDNIKVPVFIMYGENDQLTKKSEIFRFAKYLNRTNMLEGIEACSWPKFNHFDFTFAKDVGNLINRPLIRRINDMYNKYGPSS